MDKITVPRIREKKENGKKITVLTAYDFPFAKLIDEAGIDILLVGDTVGIVVQGEESTLPVTLDQMIYHTRMVSRAAKRALVVGDMPFLSYQASIEETIRNAGRFLKEGGAAAVKLEGGARVADRIEVLTRHDIPVMAHIGLTPQSVHRMGGYKVQGRGTSQAKQLLADAKTVESAGAFSLVLEGIPISLAKKITQSIKIPTIGIGAGPYCDGQVLVLHDLLGLFTRFHPKFVRRYADLTSTITEAVRRYKSDVESGKFPTEEEGYE
ncbi:MAG: 3-methyl-2-oxobutanoate hydroxymethyltransferase [Candidatus Manganitrophus sp.]|nr:3-methyl-2-oxobutanoate hydroxymethyltransferase [Candidatus Manganitrophus sp.]WDT69584.1 MAG: 3-methyl-2-oxobutanoate hydroxymethyltransferase [Candidatus Manganitrophus sp.]